MNTKKNNYIMKDNYFILQINNRNDVFDVLVSKEYYDKVKIEKWFIVNIKDRYFYVRTRNGMYLHECIYGKQNNKKIKFLNGDTLDYRKENTLLVNKNDMIIQTYNKKNKSSKVGVCYSKHNFSWEAQITINKKRIRKFFPIKTYGDNAKQLAIDTRIMWENAKIISIRENIPFEQSLKLVAVA